MDSPKREKVNVMQPQHYEQTLDLRNTINNANTSTNLNKNEHEVKGTSQSTDTSEICRDEESNFSPIKTITPPISKLAGENLTEAAPKTSEAAVNNNEETENAAMVYVDASKMSTATPTNINPISIPKTMVNTLAITTIEDPKKMQPNSKVDEFVVPAIPDTKADVGGTGTSAKKKRNKSSKKREDNKARNKANSNNIGKGATDGNRCQPPINVIPSGSANMKASVSMTSLPPDDEKSEGRDVIKAKLNVERPYNSLKKNIERNAVNATLGVRAHCFSQSQSSTSSFANHRYSWGSGYSYSSSSLQSSATFGLGSAKDDLWAAIQTNYNYIMDTNLLDTCKETERHLADHNVANGVECEQSHCAELLGVTQRRELSWHDPKELRKWLREMEERLELAPTLSTVTTLTTAELEHCLAEHSVLYHEIVSHARVVSACIRSATEEHQGQVLLQQQQEEEQQLQSIDSGSTTIAEQTNSSLTSNEETTLPIATVNEQSKHEVSGATSSSCIETAEKSSFSPGSSSIRSNSASPERAADTEITEDSLERLQNRYHLLYLKAFEVQLWLDGLLRKKSSNTSICNAAGYIDDNDNCHSSDCEEDETAATEDDLNILGSGIESDLTHNSSSFGELRDCIDLVEEGNHVSEKGDCEDGDDEGEDEDDDEVSFGRSRFGKPPRGYSTVLVTFEKRGSLGGPTRPTTLTDFEADSESSDWETTAQQVVTQKSDPSQLQLFNEEISNNTNQNVTPLIEDAGSKVAQLPFDIHTSSSATFVQQDDIDGLIATKQHESASIRASPISMKTKTNMLNADYENRKLVSMSASSVAATITTTTTANETNANSAGTQPSQKLQTLHNNTPIGLPIKQKSIAIISPNSHNNKSPTVLRKRHTQHHTDISKFNRSNRKSKNCAVFYFKHLDTDNETNCSSVGDGADFNTTADGLSSSNSQTSEHHLLKSADASSDDDGGWLYSSVLPPQLQEGAGTCDGVEIDEKGNICITTIVIDGMQSSAVTSSSALTTTPTAIRVINDDSDKENKEARAATLSTAALTTLPVTNACAQSCDISSLPSSQICTQIAHAEIQLTPVSTTSTAETALSAGRFKVKNFAASGSSSSYSTRSSSCSSNDLLTETTSATNTTQITQMHFQRVHRTEMELQIDANGNKSRHVTADGASSAVTTNNSHNNNNNGDVDNCNASNNNNATKRDDNGNHNANNNRSVVLHQPQMSQQALTSSGNNQKNEMSYSVRWHPKTVMDPTNKTAMQRQQMQKIESKAVLLPPRSPFKPEKSLPSTARSDNFSPTNVTKSKLSHESIKQLVLEAEHLVRDVEALKTPNKQKQKHSVIKLSSTVKKREIAMPGPIKQRVQEWLEHQPTSSTTVQSHRNPNEELQSGVKSKAGDDCEASGEASETDSVPHPDSDTSEGLTESIATCMQTSTNSFGGNSTECFASSAEPIVSSATVLGYGSSNQSLNVKIVKRSQSRRKSERPWSVSCLSQLTTETVPTETIAPVVGNAQTGLATHSISESALDSLSPGRQRVSSSSTINVNQVKASNSKGSLKRRKTRKKKMSTSGNLGVVATNTHSVLKKSPDSGSEDTAEMPRLTQTLLMKSCESMSTQQIREITSALLCLQRGNGANLNEGASGSNKSATQYTLEESKQHAIPQSQKDMGEGVPLMKPNFRVGSYTTAYMRNEKRLGSLAALATYMNDDEEEQQGEYTTGTEDHHSSFSETAWDNYQEKYNSENYSEGFDSDAARKLMEFGDDYRNFIDSQSDCCSSLSAANNLDSLSPPRMDSLQQADTKAITQDTIANSVDHARRRRALDLEYERRRKTLEVRRKSCQDSTDAQNTRTPAISTSSSVNAITPRIGFEKANQQRKSDSTGRKLEFGMSQSAQSLRRTSESDTSTRRRKIDDRRRSSRNLDKSIKVIPATSSSSCDDSDDEKEMRNLLQQSRNRLEDTEALKIRCHLLRPEDYTEIISTCRDNIRCLEAVLRGPPGTVLSAQCAGQTKDLLAAWEDLLNWSENAASARKMQEEMIILKHALGKLGDSGTFELLDTEPQIQVAIEALKNEKTELQNYRTNMLRLNASVHSWLTRQERRLQNAIAAEQLKDAGKVDVEALGSPAMPSVTEGEVAKCSTLVTITQGETDTVTTNINEATKKLSSSIGTSTVGSNTKVLDIQTLINSENEFHKHLKNEVSGMYSAWDDADARINTQLETLTNSLLAWRQLESGLYEFHQALGHDRGTLKGLEGALDKGQTTPVELAQNVKVVAKLLSERVNVSEEQLTAVREHLDPNHILHIAKFTASNGSLSDSGISDGGATSDGGLSERERRLGVLRRLVKQLEQALAPGSEAMKSIAVRMESAEAELKNLQNTCRDLIVRTAASHQNKKMQQQLQKTEAQQLLVPVTEIGVKGTESSKSNGNAFSKRGSPTHGQNSAIPSKAAATRNGRQKRQNKRSSGSDNNLDNNNDSNTNNASDATEVRRYLSAAAPDSGDPADDPDLEFDLDTAEKKNDKLPHNSWAWRIAKAAVPMQLALITFLCAACLMQPNCCDNLNNLSMSFTPQLRYIRGPPPI